jgi:hypothetical protein
MFTKRSKPETSIEITEARTITPLEQRTAQWEHPAITIIDKGDNPDGSFNLSLIVGKGMSADRAKLILRTIGVHA